MVFLKNLLSIGSSFASTKAMLTALTIALVALSAYMYSWHLDIVKDAVHAKEVEMIQAINRAETELQQANQDLSQETADADEARRLLAEEREITSLQEEQRMHQSKLTMPLSQDCERCRIDPRRIGR